MAKILSLTDLGITENGDLSLGNLDGDIEPKYGMDAIKQAIFIRLKTELNGCKLWTDMGQNLKTMYGKRVTRKNCEKIKQLLNNALTFGGVFDIIKTEVIPVEGSLIYCYCQIGFDDGTTYNFNFEYNFEDSLLKELQFNIL